MTDDGWWWSQRVPPPTPEDLRVTEAEHRLLVLWAADCAERVLGYFERVRPGDDRPRAGIALARSWAAGEASSDDVRDGSVRAWAARDDLRDQWGDDDPGPDHHAADCAVWAAWHAACVVEDVIHAREVSKNAVMAPVSLLEPPERIRAERDWQRHQLPAELSRLAWIMNWMPEV